MTQGTRDNSHRTDDFDELHTIHRALERISDSFRIDTPIQDLLHNLLFCFRSSVKAEAGSLYLAEEERTQTGTRTLLRFHIYQNDALHLPPLKQFTLPINDSSIVGKVALRKVPVNIPNAYAEQGTPTLFATYFDQMLDYKTVSVLCAPLVNKEGRLIGVLQLINCMASGTIGEFPDSFIHLVEQQAAHAAMFLDNARIHHELDEKFSELKTIHNALLNIADSFSLSGTLDELLARLLANFRISVKAEAGSIFLLEKGDALGEPPSLVFHIAQNDKVDLPEMNRFRLPVDDNSIVGFVSTRGEILNIPDVYALEKEFPKFKKSFDEILGYRTRSMLTAPMKKRDGEVIGVLQLINCLSSDGETIPFPEDYEAIVKLQSVQAAVFIDNARMYHELEEERCTLEIKVLDRTKELADAYEQLKRKDAMLHNDLIRAKGMQEKIVPSSEYLADVLPKFGLKFFSRFIPCDELGGDFWDMLQLDNDHLGVLTVDFAGHGVCASLNTFQLKSLFHYIGRSSHSPARILNELNNSLKRDFENHATAIYFVYNRLTQVFTLSRAGHPFPLVYRAATGEVEELRCEGTCLGFFYDIEFSEIEIKLEKNDKLLIVTDGIFEIHEPTGKIEFGIERMTELFRKSASRSAEEIYATLTAAIREFSGKPDFQDDVFFLLVERD